MDNTEIDLLVKKFSSKKIAVLGDVMLDHYIIGDASRISPEAPVPVVNVQKDKFTLGGAGNVALNLKAFGAVPFLFSSVGCDEAGNQILEILKANLIDVNHCIIHKHLQSIVKTRVVVRGQQLCRIDREQCSKDYQVNDIKSLIERLSDFDVIIISDYAKGFINSDLMAEVLKLSNKNNIFVSYDPKPNRKLFFSGVSLMTPNLNEALLLANMHENQNINFSDVIHRIYDLHNPEYLVITLGEKGMLLAKDRKIIESIDTYAREVCDVSGAGDTVIAALTLALSCGCDYKKAAKFANLAAGIVVGKHGTAVASIQEIKKINTIQIQPDLVDSN